LTRQISEQNRRVERAASIAVPQCSQVRPARASVRRAAVARRYGYGAVAKGLSKDLDLAHD